MLVAAEAICRLRHEDLLDALHILPDRSPRGEPVVLSGPDGPTLKYGLQGFEGGRASCAAGPGAPAEPGVSGGEVRDVQEGGVVDYMHSCAYH